MKILSKCMWNSRSWEKDIVKKLEKLESSGIHLIVMYQCWFLNFFFTYAPGHYKISTNKPGCRWYGNGLHSFVNLKLSKNGMGIFLKTYDITVNKYSIYHSMQNFLQSCCL